MAGYTITTDATMICPHGGSVQVIPSNTQLRARGVAATMADTFIVSGCPFQNPNASPCVTVRWLVGDTQVKTNGNATLSQSSVGLCLNGAQVAQGSVIVVQTQTAARSQ